MAVMQQPGIDLICTKKRNYYNVRRGENCAGKKYEMPDIFFSIAKSIQSFNLDINAFEWHWKDKQIKSDNISNSFTT